MPPIRSRAGGSGRLLVNIMASVLLMFTRSRQRVKYLRSWSTASLRRREMVSGRQDCVKTAVSSAYSASWTWGSRGISDIYRVKRNGDSTAPCGSPASGVLGDEDVPQNKLIHTP